MRTSQRERERVQAHRNVCALDHSTEVRRPVSDISRRSQDCVSTYTIHLVYPLGSVSGRTSSRCGGTTAVWCTSRSRVSSPPSRPSTIYDLRADCNRARTEPCSQRRRHRRSSCSLPLETSRTELPSRVRTRHVRVTEMPTVDQAFQAPVSPTTVSRGP